MDFLKGQCFVHFLVSLAALAATGFSTIARFGLVASAAGTEGPPQQPDNDDDENNDQNGTNHRSPTTVAGAGAGAGDWYAAILAALHLHGVSFHNSIKSESVGCRFSRIQKKMWRI